MFFLRVPLFKTQNVALDKSTFCPVDRNSENGHKNMPDKKLMVCSYSRLNFHIFMKSFRGNYFFFNLDIVENSNRRNKFQFFAA